LHISFVLPVMAPIFIELNAWMSESVHISLVKLLDHENGGVAFGISLLSSIEAELLRYFVPTSGNGGHL
jgi:hypothetical protein